MKDITEVQQKQIDEAGRIGQDVVMVEFYQSNQFKNTLIT